MDTLAEAWPVPMAAYGPGDHASSQTYSEYITLTDYLRGISVLRTALAEFEEKIFR
jgi:LysW-gamma-L-lysine carboxypeptidase